MSDVFPGYERHHAILQYIPWYEAFAVMPSVVNETESSLCINCREVQPPPTVHEEEPHSTLGHASPRAPAFGANPHSCSSRARPLSHGQGASPGNLLFQSPFDRDPEPPASAAGHAAPPSPQAEAAPGSAVLEDPGADDSQASPIAAARPRTQSTNPFEVPEMMDISLAEPLQGGAEPTQPAAAPQQQSLPSSLNPFEAPDPASRSLEATTEEAGELQPELEDNGEDTDAESVQEIVLDPGMGHLIAGGFGSAESIGVSTAPSPSPRHLPPGVSSSCAMPCLTPCMRGLQSQACRAAAHPSISA